jgi:glutamine amidotransferase
MNAGTHVASVTYWLLDAPDSILLESKRNPDGTGIGWFDVDGQPHLAKQPLSAWNDPDFTAEAKDVSACTLITHIRAATAGHDSLVNTHPFLIDGLIVAHNGGFGDLSTVDAQLGAFAQKVQGQTDSERYAALIAKYAADCGDVGEGIAAAASWLADNVALYSLNCLVASAGNLWALRYPDQRALHISQRASDITGESGLSHHEVHGQEVMLVASERIDGTDQWRMLDPGELVHIDPDLKVTSRVAVDRPPAHLHLLDEPDPNIDTV